MTMKHWKDLTVEQRAGVYRTLDALLEAARNELGVNDDPTLDADIEAHEAAKAALRAAADLRDAQSKTRQGQP